MLAKWLTISPAAFMLVPVLNKIMVASLWIQEDPKEHHVYSHIIRTILATEGNSHLMVHFDFDEVGVQRSAIQTHDSWWYASTSDGRCWCFFGWGSWVHVLSSEYVHVNWRNRELHGGSGEFLFIIIIFCATTLVIIFSHIVDADAAALSLYG
jgi:hypothetical protein